MKFFKKLYQKSKEQKGFTLVEMIVVLVIIAILAAITIPALLKYIDKARDKQIVINARTAYLAAETAASEAYADGAKAKNFKFNQSGSTTTGSTDEDKAIIAVEKNASELTGITKEYVCQVTVGTDWKISKVEYSQDNKTASMDVAADSSWTVSTGAIK